VNHPRILGIGTVSPPLRLTQEQSFHAAGYQDEPMQASAPGLITSLAKR
jgi:hypothetical protein